MNTTSPERGYCGTVPGQLVLPYFGGCNNFYNTSSVKVKQNITMMRDYASGSGANWIPPYATAEITALDCSPYYDGDPTFFQCGDNSNGNVFCYSVPDSYIQPPGKGTGSFNLARYHNNYVQLDETQSMTQCGVDGAFKNVYARKQWQGRLSYTSRDLQKLDVFQWCGACGYHNEDLEPDGTHYLSISANSNFQVEDFTYNQTTTTNCNNCLTCDGGMSFFDDNCTTYTLNTDTIVEQSSAEATSTIDKFGNVYASCVSSSAICLEDSTGYLCAQDALNLIYFAGADGDYTDLLSTYFTTIGNYIDSVGPPQIITGASGSWNLTWQTTQSCFDYCGNNTANNIVTLYQVNLTPTTLDIYTYGPDYVPQNYCTDSNSCITGWEQISHTSYVYSDTLFSFDDISQENSFSLYSTITGNVAGSLSNTYTSDDVYDDIVNALSVWDMGNDILYPWRSDANVNMGPLVTYDEDGGSPSLAACQNNILYSGSIIGQPGPEGIDKVWNPNYTRWCVCEDENDEEEICYNFYPQDNGAWSTDASYGCNTPCSTQWLDFSIAANTPDGAFAGNPAYWTLPNSCNIPGPQLTVNNLYYACKRAELVFPKQSYNFFRPCGVDRFQVSASSNRCVQSSSHNILSLTGSGQPNVITTNDVVLVCGGTDQDGLWKVSGASNYNITLGQCLLSGSQLPSSNDLFLSCGTGQVSRLRWENPMSPAICGQLQIFTANNNNPVTCSFNEDTFFVNGDNINISGAKGMTGLNGFNVPVIVIDNRTIALTNLNGLSQSVYLGGAWAKSPFTPSAGWNDNTSKGNFSATTWNFNYRDIGEYIRITGSAGYLATLTGCDGVSECSPLPIVPVEPRKAQGDCGLSQDISEINCITTCLPFQNCNPVVCFMSPNTESFNTQSSVNFGFVNPGLDPIYGTNWQGIIKQSMNDPLFQAPPQPCGFNGNFVVDNGDCQNDDTIDIPPTMYYPIPNQYEAICSLPENAPPLPNGAYIGCLSTSSFISGSTNCPQGNYCIPPVAPGTFPQVPGCYNLLTNAVEIPWITLTNREGCVCNDGRWASLYEQNGINCPNSQIVPPP